MKSYCLQLLPPDATKLLEAAQRIVSKLPDQMPGSPDEQGLIRCHEVARIVANLLPQHPIRRGWLPQV